VYKFVFFATFLFSIRAFACPNLAGSYTCEFLGYPEDVTVSQQNKNSVIVYTANGYDVPADNQAYKVPDRKELKNATLRAWCNDDVALNFQLLGVAWEDGAPYGDLTVDGTLSKSGKDLQPKMTGKIVKRDGSEQPFNPEVTCKAN